MARTTSRTAATDGQAARARRSDGTSTRTARQGAHGASTGRSATRRGASSGGRPATGGRATAGARTRTPARSHNRYVPALDGLRALAVLAVIAYHMSMGWAPGGLMGVTIFFVLSGYLITSILLAEHEDTGAISLTNFWLRRIRRIVPAVVFAVLGTAALTTIFDHALLTKMRPDIIPTLLFFNNWWQIFNDMSYFDALGEPSPLTHCWSLAIEEQFYLVWPVALLACLKAGVGRSTLTKGTIVLIALSALAMAVQYDPADPTFVYYGTHTRAFSLLIGALLAFLWPYRDLDEGSGAAMSPTGRIVFDAVGIAAVLGLLVMIATVSGFAAFNYRGGQLLCSLLAAVTMAVMVHPVSLLGKFFGLKPFVWIGKISYSMYLWHYPIILLMTPNNLVGELPWWMRLLQLIVIIAVSAFSYYFVENPIRHGAIGAFAGQLRSGQTTLVEWVQTHLVHAIAGAAVTLLAVGGLILVPHTSSVDAAALYQGSASGAASSASAASAGASGQSEDPDGSDTAAEPEVDPYDILLIGDSVSVRAIPYFEELFPYGKIDALINRQLYQAPELYDFYRDQGLVGDVVVFALGTNGYVTDEQIDTLMREVGADKHVWFINTRSTEAYVGETNEALARAASRYANVQIIDWYGISDGHGEYFDGDGTHLTDDAARMYARIIYDIVESYLPYHAPEPIAANADGDAGAGSANADAGEGADSTGEAA